MATTLFSRSFSSTVGKRSELIVRASMVDRAVYDRAILPPDAMIINGERLFAHGFAPGRYYPKLINFDGKTVSGVATSFFPQIQAARLFTCVIGVRQNIPINEEDKRYFGKKQVTMDESSLQQAKQNEIREIINKVSKLTNHHMSSSGLSQCDFNGSFVATEEMIKDAADRGVELSTPYVYTAKHCSSRYLTIGDILKFDRAFFTNKDVESVGLTPREMDIATKEEAVELFTINMKFSPNLQPLDQCLVHASDKNDTGVIRLANEESTNFVPIRDYSSLRSTDAAFDQVYNCGFFGNYNKARDSQGKIIPRDHLEKAFGEAPNEDNLNLNYPAVVGMSKVFLRELQKWKQDGINLDIVERYGPEISSKKRVLVKDADFNFYDFQSLLPLESGQSGSIFWDRCGFGFAVYTDTMVIKYPHGREKACSVGSFITQDGIDAINKDYRHRKSIV